MNISVGVRLSLSSTITKYRKFFLPSHYLILQVEDTVNPGCIGFARDFFETNFIVCKFVHC